MRSAAPVNTNPVCDMSCWKVLKVTCTSLLVTLLWSSMCFCECVSRLVVCLNPYVWGVRVFVDSMGSPSGHAACSSWERWMKEVRFLLHIAAVWFDSSRLQVVNRSTGKHRLHFNLNASHHTPEGRRRFILKVLSCPVLLLIVNLGAIRTNNTLVQATVGRSRSTK